MTQEPPVLRPLTEKIARDHNGPFTLRVIGPGEDYIVPIEADALDLLLDMASARDDVLVYVNVGSIRCVRIMASTWSIEPSGIMHMQRQGDHPSNHEYRYLCAGCGKVNGRWHLDFEEALTASRWHTAKRHEPGMLLNARETENAAQKVRQSRG